jgi:hypothetical protein
MADYLSRFITKMVEEIPANVKTLLTDYVLAPCPALDRALVVKEGNRIGPLSCLRDEALWTGFASADANSFPAPLRELVWIARDMETIYGLHPVTDAFLIDFLRGAFIGEIDRAVKETLGEVLDLTTQFPNRYKTRVKNYVHWSGEPEENRDFFNAGARATLVLDPSHASIIITRRDLLPQVAPSSGSGPGVRQLCSLVG